MEDPANPVEAMFAEAVGQPGPVERAAYLAAACGDDVRLRARVDALLRAHDQAGSFFANPAAATVDGAPHAADRTRDNLLAEKPGTIIGRYKLLQQIGEGGFGVVYMADQETPVKRRVALKVIKTGMDTRAVIARFEAERQALAMMDHPNIARVWDAGATETGRPYFVMELVKGIPITDYCNQASLDTAGRVKLFMDVCHAIQHAHQKGIIHRDLKPSNIMITLHDTTPVVKVIDFGIAKATEQKLTDKTLFTNYGQMIGTPVYMSPEQAVMSGLDVDTRSDIYSLGVLLYELLTGSPPFDANTLRDAGFDEMRRIIREEQPPRPSTKLSTMAEDVKLTVATQRQSSPQLLRKQLDGDLDWIVLKAIEKDRARRYDTANGLAADLQRHLDNEAVIARPPTPLYRLQKAFRRNRLAFAAVAAVAASLIFGIAASLWQAYRAMAAERQAVAVLDELRASAPAFAEQARALAAKEQFDQAIVKLDYALKLQPDDPEFLVAKGDLLQCQLRLADAATVYRQALRAKPDLARAAAAATLCDELLAAPLGKDGKPTRESLAKLSLAMQQQQRPAAELMPVARLLGEQKKLIVEYWLARLKDLPVSAERPLKERLTVRADGRLALDLGGTRVVDLAPLAGAPLATLDVSMSAELTDLAPLRGIDLVELNLTGTGVTDLTPLRDMLTLQKLTLAGTQVADLAPLGGLRLKTLNLASCAVRDLSPIRKMPLEDVNVAQTSVSDLAPLVGMPIKNLDLSRTPVRDFSPLGQLPLEKCYLQRCGITDLSVLRGKPLKELVLWGCVGARSYAVLPEIKSLELLILPSQYRDLPADDYAAIAALREHPRLRQLGADVIPGMTYATAESTDAFWKGWDREQTFLPALRKTGLKFSLEKLPAGTYYVAIQNQPLRDLSILKGAPISQLDVTGSQITDLTPIHDLPLESLIVHDPVADLSPLRGMPLKTLFLNSQKVTDLSPLFGLPLKGLYVGNCANVTDVAGLADIATLENLTVPAAASNIDALRKLPKLQRLAFRHTNSDIPETTAEEFWRDYAWISRLREAGVTPRALTRQDDGTWVVDLEGTSFADLSLLNGAPISELSLGSTAVTDLTPLRDMPLRKLMLGQTRVTDLGPLIGLPIEIMSLRYTSVTDLSPLRGMPLHTLRMFGCPDLTDLSPLAEMKNLTAITLPTNAKDFAFLRDFPKLKYIGFGEDPKEAYKPDRTAAAFWKEFAQPWAMALRAAGMNYTANELGTTGTWWVMVTSKEFSDCSIFKGSSVRHLLLSGTSVSDLRPLQEIPLELLRVAETKVTDLSPLRAPVISRSLRNLEISLLWVTDFSPVTACVNLDSFYAFSCPNLSDLSFLKGLKLRRLWLATTPVADLSPLAGMPLTELYIDKTRVVDVSPLVRCPTLKHIILPATARDVAALCALPALERISYNYGVGKGPLQSTAEFWAAYELKHK